MRAFLLVEAGVECKAYGFFNVDSHQFITIRPSLLTNAISCAIM